MLDLIIKNGWVVNATHSQQMDIAVKDGKIVAMGQASLFPEAEKTVDAAGPVSYTHLDVYKRQTKRRRSRNLVVGANRMVFGGCGRPCLLLEMQKTAIALFFNRKYGKMMQKVYGPLVEA